MQLWRDALDLTEKVLVKHRRTTNALSRQKDVLQIIYETLKHNTTIFTKA